jgi:hypothetical protein
MLGLVLSCGFVTAVFLWPAPARALPDMAIGGRRLDYRTGAQAAAAVRLVRDREGWVGAAADFTPGSLVHIRPPGQTGFFVGRLGDDSFHAFGDRNTTNGRALKWAMLRPSPRIAYAPDGEAVVGALCERVGGSCPADCYDATGNMLACVR